MQFLFTPRHRENAIKYYFRIVYCINMIIIKQSNKVPATIPIYSYFGDFCTRKSAFSYSANNPNKRSDSLPYVKAPHSSSSQRWSCLISFYILRVNHRSLSTHRGTMVTTSLGRVSSYTLLYLHK